VSDSYPTTGIPDLNLQKHAVVLNSHQVHAIRQKLQVLLLLPYTRPEVRESVMLVVRDLNSILKNTYNLPTFAKRNAAPEK
jgi:hypothetical protein